MSATRALESFFRANYHPPPSEPLSGPQDAPWRYVCAWGGRLHLFRKRLNDVGRDVATALDWRWPGTLLKHDSDVTLEIGAFYTVVSEPGVPAGDWLIVSARPGRARVVPVPGNVYDVPEPPRRWRSGLAS